MTSHLMSFNEYSSNSRGIFRYLRNLRDFTIFAKLPRLPIFEDDALAQCILYDMYENVIEVVRAAEVHHENIEIAKEPSRLIVRYSDDVYEFSAICDQEFVRAYQTAWLRVEQLPSLVYQDHAVCPRSRRNCRLNTRRQNKRRAVLNNASFRFSVLLYALRNEHNGEKVKTAEIMLKLLSALPDDSGRLTRTHEDTAAALASMGRADALLTRWTGGPGTPFQIFCQGACQSALVDPVVSI